MYMKFESIINSGNRLQLFKEINREAENILSILHNLEKDCEKELSAIKNRKGNSTKEVELCVA